MHDGTPVKPMSADPIAIASARDVVIHGTRACYASQLHVGPLAYVTAAAACGTRFRERARLSDLHEDHRKPINLKSDAAPTVRSVGLPSSTPPEQPPNDP